MSNTSIQHPSSFRDPSGFIFEKNGMLYRQVNITFKEHFDHFLQSGCYHHLVTKELIVPHEAIPGNLTGSSDWYATLKPEKIEFVSYPYEWSFDMLRDGALLTLQLVKEGLQFDMILKDASPYNIQWYRGKLIFIDTLSFEKNEEHPWIAYRQFCEAFLGPLLIMHYSRKQLPEMLLAWPDGIPVSIISSLLPKRSSFSLYTYLHIHLHAKYSMRKPGSENRNRSFSKKKLLNLIASLETLINKLKTPLPKSAWTSYYEEASQRNDYLDQKKKIINNWLVGMPGIKTAVDLGANKGEFSKLLAAKNIPVIAADFDPYCINELYTQIKNQDIKNILPLVLDLSKPSPAIGLDNQERNSFIGRAGFDLVLALAITHHLAIGKNIPLDRIARLLSQMGKRLIVEFVPKEDEKVKGMLSGKKDIYPDYNEANFMKAFEVYFIPEKKEIIGNSGRLLYLLNKRE